MLQNRIYLCLLLPLLSFMLISCEKSSETKLPEPLTQTLESELKTQHQTLNFPGAVVGLWIDDRGQWKSRIGIADKQTKEKIEFEDHFRIGSITKTFVTTAVLILVDQHKVSLDDFIDMYIKDVPNGDKITLRQLGNMTSGLPNYSAAEDFDRALISNPEKIWTTSELLALAFKQPNVFEPGTSWQYSNTNTVLLGMVIEKVTGKKLTEVLETFIFKPLDLKHTSYPSNPAMPTPFARGYTLQSSDGTEQDATFRDPSWTNAAGQIISTLDDIKIWIKALGTGKLISKDSFAERLEWVDTSSDPDKANLRYGFGIFKVDDWIGHNGELPGYNSFAVYNPKLKATFVCLVNSDSALKEDGSDMHPADTIARNLIQLIPAEVPANK